MAVGYKGKGVYKNRQNKEIIKIKGFICFTDLMCEHGQYIARPR